MVSGEFFFFNFLKDETSEKRDNCEGVILCLLILLSALLSNALLNITSSSFQVQKRLGSTTVIAFSSSSPSLFAE